MRRDQAFIIFIISFLVFLPGCDVIVDIFAAGFWTAIILIVILIGLIWWAVYKYRERD